MRTVIALFQGGLLFALIGILAAAAPDLPPSTIAVTGAAIIAGGLWLWDFIS